MTLMRIRTFQYFEFGRRRYRKLSALPLHGGERVGVKGRVTLDRPLLLTRAFGATSPRRGGATGDASFLSLPSGRSIAARACRRRRARRGENRRCRSRPAPDPHHLAGRHAAGGGSPPWIPAW